MNDQVKRPRGRPRPPETVQRDERILSLLKEEPRTRNQLAELTGVPPVKVYLSLDRLRKAGLVRICSGSEKGSVIMWSAGVGEPCP